MGVCSGVVLGVGFRVLGLRRLRGFGRRVLALGFGV